MPEANMCLRRDAGVLGFEEVYRVARRTCSWASDIRVVT
jgi:hypothetical protein